MPNRRVALKTAGAVGAATLTAHPLQANDEPQLRIVDTNAHLFRWPFRRLPLDETSKLLDKLRGLGVQSAWVASFEAILHRDMAAVNQRLAEACRPHAELVPVGALNLRLPAWEVDFQRCREHKMRIIRIYPSYHDYDLAFAAVRRLFSLCEQTGVLLQIATTMEDVRTQHPLLRKPDLPLTPLPDLLKRNAARVQLLNLRPRLPIEESLAELPTLFFDSARVDGTDGLAKLTQQFPSRVMLGTHSPLLIPEAALIRVHESGILSDEEMRAVLAGNADRLLKRGPR